MFESIRHRRSFDRGTKFLQRERWAEAAELFRRSAELRPDDSWSHNNLAVSLLKLGKFEEAAAEFGHAIRLNPTFAESHQNRAAALSKLERWDEAVRVYQEAIALDDTSAASHTNRGVLLYRLDRFDEAAEALGAALDRGAASGDLHGIRATCLIRLERFEEAADALRGAIAQDPGTPEHHASLASVLLRLEQFDEAHAILKSALERTPESAGLNTAYAQVLVRMERWEEAEVSLRAALQRDPASEDLRLALASTLVNMERWEEAAETLRAAVAARPDSAELQGSLANALANLERFDEAVPVLERAVELSPDDNALRLSLAAALVRLERWGEAAGAYMAAIERDSENGALYRSLGAALYQAESWEGSASAYRHALALDANDTESYTMLASVLANVDSSNDAIAGYQELVSVSSDDAAARLCLGIEHLKRDHWAEAVASLEAARDIASEDATSSFLLVDPLLQLGRGEAAALEHARAVEIGGDFPAVPGAPMEDRFAQRRSSFWSTDNLSAGVFAVEQWLRDLAPAPIDVTSMKSDALFVLDNDYGELTTLMYLVLGQRLAENSSLLIPERLVANNGDALPGRTTPYESVSDILDAVDRTRARVVFLCSAYLFPIHDLLSVDELEELLRGLRERGCRVVTTDPFLGMLSIRDPYDIVGISLPNESGELDIAALQAVKEVEDERLRSSFKNCERILRDLPHLYPANCAVESVAAEETDQRNHAFFNNALISLPAVPQASSSDRPHWVFILSRTDYETQTMFCGRRRFSDIVAARLLDAIAAGRHPILIAPDELVQLVTARMPTAEGIDILTFCPFNQMISLLLTAEHAFYWNVVSHSILVRLFNRLPVTLFDHGHLVRNVPTMLPRVVGWYYQGRMPEFHDHRTRLTTDTLADWSRAFVEDGENILADFQRAPTPDALMQALLPEAS